MKKSLYYIFVLFFIACGTSNKTLSPVSKVYEVTEDKEVLHIIKPYKAQFEEEMNQVVGLCAFELIKKKPDGILNYFLADALYEVSRNLSQKPIDFCVLNYGGIRLPALAKGNITKSTIYELLPFDNYLVVLEMSAEMVQQFFNHIAVNGGWPVSKQIQFKLDTIQNKAVDIKINGKQLSTKKNYHVVMPDYIANGGDDCAMLKQIPQYNLNILMRDAMLNYLYAHKDTIAPKLEKRIYYE